MTMKRQYAAAIAGLCLFGLASSGQAGLGAVGGISPDNGYPIYYENPLVSNGVVVPPGPNGQPLRLSLCLKNNGLCLLPGNVTLTNPGAPFPANYGGTFPDEAFYWTGDATVTTAGGGTGQLIMALEAAFLNGDVISGDQVVFGRIRFRIDNLVPGATYTITTPFGVFTSVAEGAAPEPRNINVTEDIGLVQGDFTVVLGAKVGPFLVPVGFNPDVPTVVDAEGVAYLADPAVATQVTGSVFSNPVRFGGNLSVPGPQNFFRIEGPSVARNNALGDVALSPDRCQNIALGPLAGNRNDCVETNLFTLSGQIASVFGVAPVRTTYTRAATGTGRIDVLAASVPGQVIEASIPRNDGSQAITRMFEDPVGSGRYFGRFSFNATTIPLPTAPRILTLTNTTDTPDTIVKTPLVDTLTVQVATFDTTGLNPSGTGTLTLRVNSSDNVAAASGTRPILKALNSFGVELTCSLDGITNLVPELPDNVTVICPVFAVGDVTITSSAGGVAKQTVVIQGPNVSGP